MHIILTHEQADFDALASLLGAHLLDAGAVPILPRRINRNVQAFLTLYGRDLPYIDPRDLTGGSIAAVTLVDTQSLISVKGMETSTRVNVVDHHPPRVDLPEDWLVTTADLGATTTMFVEAVHTRGIMLTAVEATLLLLGIYEDTGGLTYTRTTARDVRAAAYLLEQGASLEVATGFLQHPLSLRQQSLYDHLRANAKTQQIHGHRVMIAAGDAQDMQEEISTIAHKMRDLLEPDALFLLVMTRGGVQLIARSTSDLIHVGAIAAHFNGGGHERAAAALVRPEDIPPKDEGISLLAAVEQELLEVLPHFMRPAITVAQIMSHGPQVIPPETPVQDAAQRMQRYGHEGYPVVEQGAVVGLLTRRAVDRALAHKLNLTAASLMQAGDVTVQPEDSIEHLQNLMIDTGWGQIPVVNEVTREIVGIVTRTDLIKTLAPEPKLPGLQNLSERLESVLPPARLALLRAVAQQAHVQRAALYIVGGFVRDLLIERPSLDFDLVVEGDAITLARALAKSYGGRVTSHTRFGTAKWHIANERSMLIERLASSNLVDRDEAAQFPDDLPETLDLVTARTEFYTHPTALPTVERGSIKLDLHRRDFTINTLALRLDGLHYGELHDYWGGVGDLDKGLVRVLHSLSFVDDPTRMLRAIRFEGRFDFLIEARTLELLLEARPLLDRVSGDRIRHELDHILSESQGGRMLDRLSALGLLAAIHPSLRWDSWLTQQLEKLPHSIPEAMWELEPDYRGIPLPQALAYILWNLRLATGEARQVIKRLKMRNDLEEVILAASALWQDVPALVGELPSRVAARLDGAPLLALYAIYLATDEEALREIILKFIGQWRAVSPTISGHDLQARGLPPGPAYRQILTALRVAWLDGGVTSEAEEGELLEKLLDDYLSEKAG